MEAEASAKVQKTTGSAVDLDALIARAIGTSDERWEKRTADQDAKWEERAKGLLIEAAKTTELKIEKSIHP